MKEDMLQITLLLIGPGGRFGEILVGIWMAIWVVITILLRGRFQRLQLGWNFRPLTLTPAQRRLRQTTRLAIGTLLVALVVLIWAIAKYFYYKSP
jgi:uncharacterized membrane protein